MYKVSDAKFAIVCTKANIFPSISIFNYSYDQGNKIDYKKLYDDFEIFFHEMPNNDFLLSMGYNEIQDRNIIQALNTFKITKIEIILPFKPQRINFRLLYLLEERGITLFLKCPFYQKQTLYDNFSALILKGKYGAGLVGDDNIEDMLLQAKNDYQKKYIVASGGIYTKEKIKYFLAKGANAIGIGTLFATSSESNISLATKQKMILSSSSDISHIYNSMGHKKNALVFATQDHDADLNNTQSLIMGIQNPQQGGHVYSGVPLSDITEIKPLKDIVKTLI